MAHPRVCLITLDGVGIGPAPDSAAYGDEGADTLGHILERSAGIAIPNLLDLGIARMLNRNSAADFVPSGAYGKMVQRSAGKDSITGHWEIAGIVTETPFPVFTGGFPPELIVEFERRAGVRCLGNVAASGTEIIRELGLKSRETGSPIVYTSTDSVFQIAAHTDVIPVEELYRICLAARDILQGPWAVGRVIARPFTGSPGNYVRTDERRDFALPPPGRSILDSVRDSGREVVGIGKIEDLFAGRGLTRSVHTHDDEDGVRVVIEELGRDYSGLIFANLVDFDMKYGHRRDIPGFAGALETFDRLLPAILCSMRGTDSLIITADHGNDPAHHGTDHTREQVPLLAVGRGFAPGRDLGMRSTFADVAATVADLLDVPSVGEGRSFAGRD
jgi:phosphopentomutase